MINEDDYFYSDQYGDIVMAEYMPEEEARKNEEYYTDYLLPLSQIVTQIDKLAGQGEKGEGD